MKLVWIRRRSIEHAPDMATIIGGWYDDYNQCSVACRVENDERRCRDDPFVPYPVFVDGDRELNPRQIVEEMERIRGEKRAARGRTRFTAPDGSPVWINPREVQAVTSAPGHNANCLIRFFMSVGDGLAVVETPDQVATGLGWDEGR